MPESDFKAEIVQCLDRLLEHRPERVFHSEISPLPPGRWKNPRCYGAVRLSMALKGINRVNVHCNGRWRTLEFSPGEAVVYLPMSWTANIDHYDENPLENIGIILYPDFIRIVHSVRSAGSGGVNFDHHLHIGSPCLRRSVVSMLTLLGDVAAEGDRENLLPDLCFSMLKALRSDAAGATDCEDFSDLSVPIQRWRNICAYMAENYNSLGTRQEVAEHFNISESSISKYFLRYGGGRTFNRMLTDLRMEAAKRLLESSELDCRSIAAACGFRSANYFSQNFRHRTGYSPQEYRRNKQ